jgi:CcmD family protein
MGPWGFVFLAYGIVWGAILLYLVALKRRYLSAQAELDRLHATMDIKHDEKK